MMRTAPIIWTGVKLSRREKECGYRVNIADQRHRLSRQLLQTGEIEQIRKASVYGAYDRNIGQVGTKRMRKPHGQQTINKYDREGDIQFDRGSLQAFRMGDSLIENDQRRVKQRRGDSCQQPCKIHPAGKDAAADADKADCDDDDGGHFYGREFFAKEERRKKQDKDGSNVVDQRCQTDVQQTVGSK